MAITFLAWQWLCEMSKKESSVMRKKHGYIIASILVLSVMICSSSVAQVIPDIPVLPDLGLACDDNLSGQALQVLNANFGSYRSAIEAFANGLPDTMSDMKTKILAMLNEAETRMANLNIAVCFTTTVDYAAVYSAYDGWTNTDGDGVNLDDVSTQELQNLLKEKESQLAQAGVTLTDSPIPSNIRSTLEEMNKDGDLQATRGKLGNSRISILSVYVPPDMSEVMVKTTVVIATEN
jgi:hypothetical protein